MKNLNWTTATAIGGRERNEDAFSNRNAPSLAPEGDHPVAVVCDGLGGYAHGEVASRAAVDTFMQTYLTLPSRGTPIPDRLRTALQVANGAIRDRIEAEPRLYGMGTTLVGAAVTTDGLWWISVGDSPLWLWSAPTGQLRQLNTRHNSPGNPHRLTSALMGDDIPLIDTAVQAEPLRPDDAVILASDGLDTLPPETISDIAARNASAGASDLACELVAAAVRANKPRQDNTSAVCLRMREAKPTTDGDVINGIRTSGEAIVTIGGRPLDWQASLKVRNHSPTGVEWGYSGSGPAQLALAILLTLTDRETAEARYHAFKEQFIAPIRSPEWRLPIQNVHAWIAAGRGR